MNDTERSKAAMRLKKALLFAYNVSFERFSQLLPGILATHCVPRYIQEHWDRLRESPARWILELDSDSRERYVQAVINEYGD